MAKGRKHLCHDKTCSDNSPLGGHFCFGNDCFDSWHDHPEAPVSGLRNAFNGASGEGRVWYSEYARLQLADFIGGLGRTARIIPLLGIPEKNP